MNYQDMDLQRSYISKVITILPTHFKSSFELYKRVQA